MKKALSLSLVLCMILSLAACGGDEQPASQVEATASVAAASQPEEQQDRPMTEGWLMTELELPYRLIASSPVDSDGDMLWLAGRSQVDGAWQVVLLGYDTIGGTWQQIELTGEDLGITGMGLDKAMVSCFSVKDGLAWMQVEAFDPGQGIRQQRLATVDTASGQASSLTWDLGRALDEPNEYIAAFAALEGGQALIVTPREAAIVDRSLNRVSSRSMSLDQVAGCCEIGSQLYLTGYESLASFDTGSLSLGKEIPVSLSQSLQSLYLGSSAVGNILCTGGQALYSLDGSGKESKILDWMDVALSSAASQPFGLFENSRGEYFTWCDSGEGLALMKTAWGPVPVKDSLTMACFFDTQSTTAQTRMTPDMTDAILAYNNSGSGYRIEPVWFQYEGEGDLTRALMEAFNSQIDLVDQSNLPEGSVSGSQLMDMLPFLDQDPELSREDFFPAALEGMTWGGHMYRVSPYYSVLAMNLRQDGYPGEDQWSSQWLCQAIEADPSLALGLGKNYTQERIVNAMAHAMTAEFIDLGTMSCDFTRPEFEGWLNMTASLIDTTGLAQDGATFDCGVEIDYMMRGLYASEGISHGAGRVIVGFPDSRGSGFYLASPGAAVSIMGEYNGMNTSLSIASGCKDPQAAWDFVKQLLTSAENGVPVLRSVFESRMDYYARAYYMLPEDVEALRYMAEQAAGTVLGDRALIELICSEVNAYLSGDKTAQDIAQQLQSRVSIYLAEQG